MSDTRLVTAAELERRPEDDFRYELLAGRLIQLSPTGWDHGRIVARLLVLLDQFARPRNLGFTVTEVGFKLTSDPDTVRAPDVAFVRRERMHSGKLSGFWTGPPDLAVEVISPDDRPGDIGAKVKEYLTCGALAVVVVDPDERAATTYHRLSAPVTVRDGDELDLADVVEGFRCPVREILD